MRYWAWFVAKLAVAVVGVLGMVKFVVGFFPADDDPYAPLGKGMRFLLCDLALMLCFLIFCGALYLIVRDQRYRCRACGCHFTDTPLRGKPPAMKALAVLLYGMGGMSFSGIGRLLGVSDVAVLKWVHAEAAGLPEPEVPTIAAMLRGGIIIDTASTTVVAP